LRAIGVDLGFGFTKATDGTRSTIFKSIIGEATAQQFGGSLLRHDVEAEPDNAPSGDEYLHLALDVGEFFFGELAERQSNVRSFTLDQGRFIEEASLPFTLAAVSALGYLDDTVRLVVGLPISDFGARADELERRLRGRHDITMVSPSAERHHGTLTIDDVKTIPEPFGAIYDMVLDDRGELVNQPIAEEKVGVIDIGFHTVDFTVSDRTAFLERASRSSEAGIARAFSVIAAKLREKSDVNLPVYRLYDAAAQGRIRIRGDVYDLGKLTEHVFGQLASEIATQANELWADEWDMDRVIIAGGGGQVLGPYLEPLLQGRVETAPAGSDARMGNARGFAKYAAHLWGDADDDPGADESSVTVEGADYAEADASVNGEAPPPSAEPEPYPAPSGPGSPF
jgi:plasmid segregation protein ParM